MMEVTAAVIWQGDKFLICQRPREKYCGLLWKFPDGKIEPGETPEQALARECREELALEIENERIIGSVMHEYPEKTIRLTLIECSPKPGSIPKALEHQQIRWVSRAEMEVLPFCPADADLIKTLSF